MRIERPIRGMYIDGSFLLVLLVIIWLRHTGFRLGTDYFIEGLLVFFLVGAVYRASTPFVFAEDGKIVLYGFAPWHKRAFSIENVAEVRYNVSGTWAKTGVEVVDNASVRTQIPAPWVNRSEAVNYAEQLRGILGAKLKAIEG